MVRFIRQSNCRWAWMLLVVLSAWTQTTLAQHKSAVAYQDKEVRFTVITDGVVRMEWQADGRFTDQRSLMAIERSYAPVDYSVKATPRKVTIDTEKMHLEYLCGTGRFAAYNLSVKSKDKRVPFVWRPGMKQQQNLKGTFRTLDGLEGLVQTQPWVTDMTQGETRQFEDGLLAKDGWTLIDDTSNFLFDDSEWPWVQQRTTTAADTQDWYLMVYGHDYRAALRDFTRFAGRIPMPPRFAFGYWWSRYWAYSDKELRQLTDNFDRMDIPLDVLVIDMDWHYTDEGRGGWTGWTWNESLFPDWKALLADLHDRHLKTTLNLHPAAGIDAWEQQYDDMARDLGIDAAKKANIPWQNSDKRFMTSVFSNVLHPMQRDGVDFWWLDWQQEMNDARMPGLNNTWWINYCFFTDMERWGDKRPLLYHRWGGLGNHRYQVGFSGDAVISWKSLAFQPYFTSTASNVLYGYWSHDIGGHLPLTKDNVDPEMYTRWLQLGAFSPIMRTHSSREAYLNKEPWAFSHEVGDILRQTIRQRYQLVPYIYTMARKAYETGVSLCRPLYYDYPEEAGAYEYTSEYMFGDQMLIAPVVTPMTNGYATVDLWLPEGDWYELHSGQMLSGGKHQRRFALDEYGIYVKAGSILPMYGEHIRHLDNNDEPITLTIVPGREGRFTMYEDGGNDKRYAEEYTTTELTQTTAGQKQTIRAAPRKGSYQGMPTRRQLSLRVLSAVQPLQVTVGGKATTWAYNGNELALSIDLGQCDCQTEQEIVITYPDGDIALNDGLRAKFRRIARTVTAMKYRMCMTPIDPLAAMASIGEALTYHPEQQQQLIDTFRSDYERLPELLQRQKLSDDGIAWFLQQIDCPNTLKTPADYINVGIGVVDSRYCNCVAGPRVPYSSISPSPQTLKGGPDGYDPKRPVLGFGQLHVSGTGWGSYGHFLLSPQTGVLETRLDKHQSPHSDDVYKAYYYSTMLDRYGIRTELTPAHHSAMYRLTMPTDKPSFLLFDASQALPTDIETYQKGKVLATETEIDGQNRRVKMHLRYQGGWIDGPYDVYCVAEVNQPFSEWGTWHGEETLAQQRTVSTAQGDTLHAGAYCQLAGGGEVVVRLAVSFVTCERAQQLLHDELPHWDFDQACRKARDAWNDKLSAISIDTPDEDRKTIFYSALYRVFTAMADRTKDNPYDPTGRRPYYDDNYAYWDTFRSLFPLLMLIDEPTAAGNINTQIDIFKRDGNVYDGFIAGRSRHDEQGGNDVDHIIAEACLKDVKGVDWQQAYAIVKHHADKGRLGYRSKESRYRQLGYIPEDAMSSSLTLEYAYNDYSAALMARKLGKKQDYRTYLERSANWEKLWNKDIESRGYSGFIDARREDGTFTGFNAEQYGGSWTKPFYEANSWTYSFYVPHDFDRLIALMGGPQQFVERLEYGFKNRLFKSDNEPGFLTTYAFSHAGRPDLTSYWAHQLMQRGFDLTGYPENEDTGAVGAWYVFATLGLFPNAGQDFYYLLAPSVSQATLQLPRGKQLVIRANASAENVYIKSCRLNGKPVTTATIRHSQIANGGTLEFELSNTPTAWGQQ